MPLFSEIFAKIHFFKRTLPNQFEIPSASLVKNILLGLFSSNAIAFYNARNLIYKSIMQWLKFFLIWFPWQIILQFNYSGMENLRIRYWSDTLGRAKPLGRVWFFGCAHFEHIFYKFSIKQVKQSKSYSEFQILSWTLAYWMLY